MAASIATTQPPTPTSPSSRASTRPASAPPSSCRRSGVARRRAALAVDFQPPFVKRQQLSEWACARAPSCTPKTIKECVVQRNALQQLFKYELAPATPPWPKRIGVHRSCEVPMARWFCRACRLCGFWQPHSAHPSRGRFRSAQKAPASPQQQTDRVGFREESRLGIPISFINEGLHGGAPGGTIFPEPIGQVRRAARAQTGIAYRCKPPFRLAVVASNWACCCKPVCRSRLRQHPVPPSCAPGSRFISCRIPLWAPPVAGSPVFRASLGTGRSDARSHQAVVRPQAMSFNVTLVSKIAAAIASEASVSAPQSVRQIWTALHHDGPNHPGLRCCEGHWRRLGLRAGGQHDDRPALRSASGPPWDPRCPSFQLPLSSPPSSRPPFPVLPPTAASFESPLHSCVGPARRRASAKTRSSRATWAGRA